MGAGKGNNNRVNARARINPYSGKITEPLAADQYQYFKCDDNYWMKYCIINDIKDENIVQYYLGKKLLAKDISKDQAEHILTELFRDNILSGSMIIAPDVWSTSQIHEEGEWDAYDFEIKIDEYKHIFDHKTSYTYKMIYIPTKKIMREYKVSHGINPLYTSAKMYNNTGALFTLGSNNPHLILRQLGGL